ncbi:SH3 domain-containing protein [Bacillus sp. SCS-153A]|uniref:SH3 domain-containing protein n=1 Tax=Rossellomorea sedimentorum TaxID=3115294 RepID=UPI003905B14A
MIKKVFYNFIIFLLLLGSLPAETQEKAAAEATTVIIDTHTLNVRKGPGLSFPVIEQVYKGEEFKVVSTENDWYKIQLNSSGTGWVANWLVKVQSSSTSQKNGTVTDNGLRMREGPGTNFPIIDTLSKGQEVKITESSGNWYKVSIGSQSGWVHKDYIAGGAIPSQNSGSSTTIDHENWTGVSTVNSLNVRSSAGLNGSIIGKLNKGSKVSVTGSVSGWYRIKFGGSEGWTSSQYIEKSSSPPAKETNQGAFGKVTVYSLNVRDKASLNGRVTDSVKQNEVYEILEEKNNWYKLSLKGGKTGWAAGWYIEKTVGSAPEEPAESSQSGYIQILYNGTNLRSKASTSSSIVARASAGESYAIQQQQGDWYKIALKSGQTAYVAGWIVSVSGTGQSSTPVNNAGGLKGKTIVIDPGHGGRDSGTVGYRETLEKELTLSTSQLLYELLRNAGANVILTRDDDTYSSLSARVALAHYHNSDAFISVHYDSIYDSSIKGYTAYYYHSYQKELSQSIIDNLATTLSSRNRGVKNGNYYVLRENKQPAVLLELGYLSNPTEEALVNTHSFQDMAARSIYNGLNEYFRN